MKYSPDIQFFWENQRETRQMVLLSGKEAL